MKNLLDIETEVYCCQFCFVAHGYKFFCNFYIDLLLNFFANGKAFFMVSFAIFSSFYNFFLRQVCQTKY